MTDNDRTIQVPESLIKGLRDALAQHDDSRCEVDNRASDQAYISHVDKLLAQAGIDVLSGLSGREIIVLFCWAGGQTLGETAEELGVAQSTVKTYRERIRRKTGQRNPHLTLLRQGNPSFTHKE